MAEGDIRPIPDPTLLTTEAVNQAVNVAKDYTDGKIAVLVQRIEGMDKATELLSEEVNRVPSKLSQAIENVEKVVDTRFESIAQQFRERDIRSEREARDNKIAVDAAFAAQKESAAREGESNAKAINKSESATTETIKTNQELTSAKIDGLTKGLDEAKLAISRLETSKVNASENRTEHRASSTAIGNYIFGSIAAFVGIASLILAIYISNHP
jgi:chromosome segregation ATPase